MHSFPIDNADRRRATFCPQIPLKRNQVIERYIVVGQKLFFGTEPIVVALDSSAESKPAKDGMVVIERVLYGN